MSADFYITIGRNRCHILAQTEAAIVWLKDNIWGVACNTVALDKEFAHDWVEKIQEYGFTTEIKS